MTNQFSVLLFLIAVVFSDFLFGLAQGGTCTASFYRREPCGYKNIAKFDCEFSRGCCYEPNSPVGIPRCYKPVADVQTVEKCSDSEVGRRPCGYRYISKHECTRRGCCFKTTSKPGVPYCYKPALYAIRPTPAEEDPTVEPARSPSSYNEEEEQNAELPEYPVDGEANNPDGSLNSLLNMFLQMDEWQNATRSCEIVAASRNDCGYPGIAQESCEEKGCCWDNSNTEPGVYWCFYPVWRSRVASGSHDGTGVTVSPPDVTTVIYEPPIPTTIYGEEWDTTVDDTVVTTTTEQSTSPTSIRSSPSPTPKFVPPLSPWYDSVPTTEVLPPFEDMEDPPIKDNVQNLLAPTYNTRPAVTTSTAATSTIRTTTTLTPNGANQWPSAQYMLQLINYYSAIHKAKPSSNEKDKPTATCSAEATSCCKSNPSSPCCEYASPGQRSSIPDRRIVGGGHAGHLRSSVAYLTTRSYGSQFCGGTLINKQWVVTAAHCVLDYCTHKKRVSEILIKLGKISKSNFKRGANEQIIPAREVVCHPHNCRDGNRPRLNDIALVKLSRPIIRTAHVSPAALPFQSERPIMNRRCIVLGWGETRGRGNLDALKEVKVPIYSNEQCNLPEWRNCMVRACMMCGGELNMDACEGDSGGPLFCERSNGSYVLHGVYSWGRCGAEEKKPAVYTRFSYYTNWIKRVVYSQRAR